MKSEKVNNPLAVGALGIVFIGALVYAFKGMFGGDAPAASTAHAANVSSADTKVAVIAVEGNSDRDPFSHELLFAKREAKPGSNNVLALDVRGASGNELGLPPLGIQSSNLKMVPVPGMAPIIPKPADESLANGSSSTVNLESPMARLSKYTLTAIVGGKSPAAVLEGAGGYPKILHIGDLLDDLKVTAINREAVTLTGHTGIWSLTIRASENHDSDNAVREDKDAHP